MAGNSKSKRKPAPKGIGTRAHTVAMLAKAKAARHAKYEQINERARMKNNLPLGHPLNVYKLDKTFKPFLAVLDEQDRTGTMLVDDKGQPLMWDEDAHDYTHLVPAILHMCHVVELVAGALVWGKMPPGLNAMALKLARNEKLVEGDTDDARATLAWMRERMSKTTVVEWSERFAWALDLAEKQQEAA